MFATSQGCPCLEKWSWLATPCSETREQPVKDQINPSGNCYCKLFLWQLVLFASGWLFIRKMRRNRCGISLKLWVGHAGQSVLRVRQQLALRMKDNSVTSLGWTMWTTGFFSQLVKIVRNVKGAPLVFVRCQRIFEHAICLSCISIYFCSWYAFSSHFKWMAGVEWPDLEPIEINGEPLWWLCRALF